MIKRESFSQMDTLRVRFAVTGNRRHRPSVKPRCVNGRELPRWENGPDLQSFVKELHAHDLYLVSYRAGEYVFERCDD